MIMKPKIAYLGLFTAIAVIFGYVESLVPVFAGIPGIKLGLANLSVLLILKRYGLREAFLVSLARILIIGFMFGSLFSILYSAAGAALSLGIMYLIMKTTEFSLISISVAGGVSHNIAQVLVAVLITETPGLLFYYLPMLLVSGVVTGIVIGVLTSEVHKRLPVL